MVLAARILTTPTAVFFCFRFLYFEVGICGKLPRFFVGIGRG